MIYKILYEINKNTSEGIMYLIDQNGNATSDFIVERNLIVRYSENLRPENEPTHYDSDADFLFRVDTQPKTSTEYIEEGKFWAAMECERIKNINSDCGFIFTPLVRKYGIDEASKYGIPMYYMEKYYQQKAEIAELKKDIGDLLKPLFEKYDVTIHGGGGPDYNEIKQIEISKKIKK